RYNDDYIGWAPLPPYASFSISIGIRFTTRWSAPAHYWSFVRYRNFASTRIDGQVVDDGYSRRLIRTTRGAVRYEVDRDRVINRGVDRALIERRGNMRITRTEVGETRERDERIVRDGGRERIEVYRPSRTELEQRDERIEARKPERRISLDMERVERNRPVESRDRRTDDSRSPTRDSRDRSPSDRRTYDQDRSDGRAPNIRREQSEPQRKESAPAERKVTPERRDSRNEFRSVQPQPSTPGPARRDGSGVRSQPRKDGGHSRSGGKRGRDQ
ncbi:MAG: hypothetical protein HYW57_09565, partial [Ignavibacteriales bacterium]|nr:hypothetical protein [Ignavibacteriales bacterium]